MGEMTEDYLWIASAIEGRICATILLDYIQLDTGHIVPRANYASEAPEEDSQDLSTISSIAGHYRVIASNYARMRFTDALPDLVYVECCLRIARFLATAYLNRGWNEITIQLLVQRNLCDKESVDMSTHYHPKMKDIPRSIIGQWVTKVFEANINAMPLLDQHRRAHLFKTNTRHDAGVLQLTKQMCYLYGIGECDIYADEGLDETEKSSSGMSNSSVRGVKQSRKNEIVLGWPQLQVDVLKQCIAVSEALLDNKSQLYYTAILLKTLYQHISKPEQIRLATSIQAMTSTTKKKAAVEPMVNYWGVNIISSIEPKDSIPRKAIYVHSIHHEASKVSKDKIDDPFIYNPFAQKKEEKNALLVKNDLCEFKVTLTNPFGFDLELRNIILSTSGVAFFSVPTAISIPANATITMLLAGTPKETGILIIRGCKVQIVGFLEQEFLVEPGSKELVDESVVKIKKIGLNAIKYRNRRAEPIEEIKQENFYNIKVVDEQPLLKIKSTSLLHGAIMLYEGEVAHITIEIENIGNIPVNFIRLSFTESTTIQPLPFNYELPLEEQYELELRTKGAHVFSWDSNPSIENPIDPTKEIWLTPGGMGIATIKVFGKRDCCGGSIQIDYGYLNRSGHHNADNSTDSVFFYTRQLYMNVLLTVYQHLEPSNWDIVYIRHTTDCTSLSTLSLVEENTKEIQINATKEPKEPVEYVMDIATNTKIRNQFRNYYCFVAFDIANIWKTRFDVTLSINNEDDGELISNITIQPGRTARILLPVKRLFLLPEMCLREIPSIDPNKQFVKSKESEEQQLARRQLFWYREELLNRIKCTWYCRTTERHGVLNLRSFARLTPKQLVAIKKENIEFSIDVKGCFVQKTGHRQFKCGYNQQITTLITISNRLMYSIRLILRIQPIQNYTESKKEYRLPDNVLIEGMQQVLLPEVPASNGQVTYAFPMYFLSSGQFEILYHAEDINTRKIYYDHEWITFNVIEPSSEKDFI
ncbi:hypothetical protein G6F60_011238 [Rhizopus arrhizus]|nr:hypothetical protein G6F60_011238 [Rhizopus arrhizus]